MRPWDAFSGLAMHAGVVASAGAVVAFPAESGTGKSTITAACGLAGFDYVSDEALCIDPRDGRVVVYAKPMALAASGWAMIGADTASGIDDGTEVVMTADQLHIPIAGGDLRLAHVIELVRGVEPTRLVEHARQESLALLLRMSFNHYKHPRQSFELASQLAASSRSWRLEYTDPRPTAELLRAALG